MRPDTAETRARLIATAERLYAERGLDGVSLVEISREAGQRNRGAAQYHFTDKAGLVQAILDKHVPGIETARHALIDALEAQEGEPPLRAWVEALVRPVAAKLDDPDGGRAFLRVQAERMRQPEATLAARSASNRGAERLLRGMTQAMTRSLGARASAGGGDAVASARVPTAVLGTRMMLTTGLLFHGMSDYLARDAAGDAPPRAVFVETLVDAIEALLGTAPSDAALAAARSRAR
ncbi:MAG: TetR/AcrR family transcriptional regulator [Myxococcales bacterium]|nr:TetR/AcrR family transcriptional regulator [Myxococcales bacterium]MCB9629565.1 TetR/AcrR family transcriptional regulator [Sandaracinaceae bacterium]